jgi:hypothetical protein
MKRFVTQSEIDDPIIPLAPRSVFTTDKSKIDRAISVLLANPRPSEGHCFGSACALVSRLVYGLGATVFAFCHGLPTIGESQLLPRSYQKLLGTQDESRILTVPLRDEFYRYLGVRLAESGACTHLFVGGSGFVDLASLSVVSNFTNGRVHFYPDYDDARDGLTLQAHLFSLAKCEYFHDCYFAVRGPKKAVRFSKMHGTPVLQNKWYYFPAIYESQSIAFEIDLSKDVTKPPVFSATVIHTNRIGQRIVRVFTWALTLVAELDECLGNVDAVAVAALTVKAGSRLVLGTQPANGLASYRKYLRDVFSSYGGFLSGELMPFAHFCHMFQRSIVFDSSADVDVDARMQDLLNLRTMNATDLLLWLHPRAFELEGDAPIALTRDSVAGRIVVVHMYDRVLVWFGEGADRGLAEAIFGEGESVVKAKVWERIRECCGFSGKTLPVQVGFAGDATSRTFERYLVESAAGRNEAYESWYRDLASRGVSLAM